MESTTKPSELVYSKFIGFKSILSDFKITSEDSCLYALCLGFSNNHFTPKDMKFTYELSKDFRVFPTYAAAFPLKFKEFSLPACPGVPEFSFQDLLHVDTWLEIVKPLPVDGEVIVQSELVDAEDKGVGTYFVTSVKLMNKNDLSDVYANIHHVVFVRGLKGGKVKSNGILKSKIPHKIPDFQPFKEVKVQVKDNFVFFYRLIAGIKSRFHVDSVFSKVGDKEIPLLPGLCFYGITAKEAYEIFGNDNPDNLISFNARFKSFVYPGETLTMKFWKVENGLVIVSVEVVERNSLVLHGELKFKVALSEDVNKKVSMNPKF